MIAQYTQLPNEEGNNRSRFKQIAEMLSNEGHDLLVVTSKFRELDRVFRQEKESYNTNYQIKLINEIGYTKNISIKRILSMYSFSKNLKKYLSSLKNEKFDVVYCCVPGLDSAYVASKFAKNNNISFLIDVQDIWPEVMRALIIDTPIISDIIFSPFQYLANKVYESADGIMAVSKTYLDVAKEKNKKSKYNDYVYIGFDSKAKKQAKPALSRIENDSDTFSIGYIGSLGHSYDLKTLIKAVSELNKRNYSVKAIIMGSGPLEEELKQYAFKEKANIEFTGWLNYETMHEKLNQCDSVINAIKSKSVASVTNKFGDYLAAGKPMLNGSNSPEIIALVNKNRIGINYNSENWESLSMAIIKMLNMEQVEKEQMGVNALKLASESFVRENSYKKIIDMIGKFMEGNENEKI